MDRQQSQQVKEDVMAKTFTQMVEEAMEEDGRCFETADKRDGRREAERDTSDGSNWLSHIGFPSGPSKLAWSTVASADPAPVCRSVSWN